MAWGSITSGIVTNGTNSARVNLNPYEIAHVQIHHSSGSDRMLVRVFPTLENDPGVSILDNVGYPEFRLNAGDRISFPITGYHAFVVAIDTDPPAFGATAATVRIRKNGVNL